MSNVEQQERRIPWPVWGGLALVGVTLAAVFLLARGSCKAPGGARAARFIGQIADFSLTNQDGRAVSLADLRGQVWVADIIFTRCRRTLPDHDPADEGNSRTPCRQTARPGW